MKPLYIATVLFTLCSGYVFPQAGGTLKGKVSYEESGGLSVSVGIPALGIGTVTAANGEFVLKNVPAGTHTFVARLVGYKTLEQQVAVRAGETLDLGTVVLQEDLVTLNEVTIIDEQSGLSSRTPYSVTSVSAKEIALKSNPSGLMGFLREESGITGAEMGQGIVKPFIRGLGFSRVVTIYQGNKLENHPWGADHGLGLNDLGIGKIDVIKGPASILYGSGAIGGVILVKDDDAYMAKNEVTGNAGLTYNSVSGGARGFGSVGKAFGNGFFVAADAAYENHADYVDGNGRVIGNSRFNTETIRLHTGINKEKFSNKLSYTYNRQNLGIIEDTEMEEGESLATTRYDRDMQLPFQDVRDHLLSYKQNTEHGRFSTFFSISHHLNLRKEIEDDFDGVDLGLRQSHTFYNARATFTPSDKLEHNFGVQGSYINLKNMEEAEEILIPDATSFENGAYYMANLSLGTFFLQGGLRYDFRRTVADASAPHLVDYGFVLPGEPADRRLGRNFSGFTGSLGLSKTAGEHSTFRLNLSTGYRAPDLAEVFSNGPHPGTNRFEIGNDRFGREQSFQTDLSWAYRSAMFSASASVFGNLVDNYIFFAATGASLPNGLEVWGFQQANALLFGTELFASYSPFENNRLELTFHGNLVRGQRRDLDEDITFIPADNYTLRVKARPTSSKKTAFFTSLRYVADHNRPGLNEESTPGYALLGAGANHQFQLGGNTLTASITAFNLLNQTYVDHMSVLRAFNVNSPGRNVMASLMFNF